jgi:hypothetical protein
MTGFALDSTHEHYEKEHGCRQRTIHEKNHQHGNSSLTSFRVKATAMEKLANHRQNRATKAGVPKKCNMKPRKKAKKTNSSHKMDG